MLNYSKRIIKVGSPDQQCLYNKGLLVGNLNRQFKQILRDMKQIAITNRINHISGNMINFPHRVFWFKLNGQWQNVINPKIKNISEATMEYEEKCPCLPHLSFQTTRHQHIQVSFWDESRNEKNLELSGQEARIFQHEMDHLLGFTLLDWNISQGRIKLLKPASDYFQKALENYIQGCNDMLREYPQAFERTLKQFNFDPLDQDEGINGPSYEMFQPEQQIIYEKLKQKLQLEYFYIS